MARNEKPAPTRERRCESLLRAQAREAEARRQAWLASLDPRDRERLAFPDESDPR